MADGKRRNLVSSQLSTSRKSIVPGGQSHAELSASIGRKSISRQTVRAPSALGSTEGKRQKVNIWPEWSDTDINSEKWDVVQKGKEKEKGKSPTSQNYFDDPEGKILMPPSFKVHQWKRPLDIILEKPPVVVDPECTFGFDLITNNEHILFSETMRWIVCQIDSMWQLHALKATGNESPDVPVSPQGNVFFWKPWEHIYAINKIGKGPNMPQFNPCGKYVVKLYWLGAWRKITIDDSIPCDESDRPLLPFTTESHELWPMLLTKALLKIASLDYGGGSEKMEFGDFSVIHCFTGWIPQTLVVSQERKTVLWKLLNQMLPEWKLPELEKEKSNEEDGNAATNADGSAEPVKDIAAQMKDLKTKKDEKPKGKDVALKDVKKDKKEKSTVEESQALPDKPQTVVFGSYHDVLRNHPYPALSLTETADRSERQRRQGLSHLLSHPVMLRQIRACPLTPPPPPEVVPAWKLIRPRVKKPFPRSEEGPLSHGDLLPEEINATVTLHQAAEVDKPIQCIEVQSPFVQYKVSETPIPQSTSRPISALQRGGTHVATPLHPVIAEDPPPTPTAASPLDSHLTDLPTPTLGPADKKSHGATLTMPTKDEGSGAGLESKRPSVAKRATGPGKTPGAVHKTGSDGGGKKTLEDKMEDHDASTEVVKIPEDTNVSRKMWMDLDKFCECFQLIHVFHKPNTYPHSKIFSDMKNVAGNPSSTNAQKDIRKGGANPNVNAVDEKSPQYLYVDNVQPTEIIFSMAAICRWNDPPTIALPTGGPSSSAAPLLFSHTPNGTFLTEPTPPRAADLQSASMLSEWHYWKRIRMGDHFKRMNTTGMKAVSFHLPPGRHCLKLYIRAPIGYYVNLFSSQPFVFGDEDTVLPHTKTQPLRVQEYGTKLLQKLMLMMDTFSDEEKRIGTESEYEQMLCPFSINKSAQVNKHEYFQMCHEVLYQLIKKAHGDKVNADLSFAWRVVNRDVTSVNPLGVAFANRPPTTSSSAAARTPAVRSKPDSKKRDHDLQQLWVGRDPTEKEIMSVTRIQKIFRGFQTRKLMRARDPQAPEHRRVVENLLKSKLLFESNVDQHGLTFINSLLQAAPKTLKYFPFANDYENYCTYQDYQGNSPEQPPGSFCLLFREVFHVKAAPTAPSGTLPPKKCFALAKVSIQPHMPTFYLRIINNDTGEELERTLGERNIPRYFVRNHRGYSFVAVARTGEQSMVAGRWRLRVVGHGGEPWLQPSHNDLCSNFIHQELSDYYVPNKDNMVVRQILSVNGADEQLVTIHVRLSRLDLPVTLNIMDYDDVIYTTTGLGQVIVPALLLQKEYGPDPTAGSGQEEEAVRSSSRQSGKASLGRKKGSAKSHKLSPHGSVASGLDGLASGEGDSSLIRLHKYSIQATIPPHSWPLSKANWLLVETLKQQELEEMKMNGKPREVSPPRLSNVVDPKKDGPGGAGGGKGGGKGPAKGAGTGSAAGQGAGKDSGKASVAGTAKGGGASGAGGKNTEVLGSRPDSVTLDTTKAHWVLRVYCDSQLVEDLTVRRDSERAEEIRAMKKAWEEMEPGRAERAKQARLRYLNARMVKNPAYVPPTTEVPPIISSPEPSTDPSTSVPPITTTGEEEDNELTVIAPSSIHVPEFILPPLDLSAYMRGDPSKAQYKDHASRMQAELEVKQKEMSNYREMMAEWEQWCVKEKSERNQSKIKQLEVAYQLQGLVDHYRETYFREREAIRIKRLWEEYRKKQEENAAQDALLQQEAAAKGGKKGSPTSARGKKSPNSARKKKK